MEPGEPPPDADALRRALSLSREQRAAATRGRLTPPDTLHLLAVCPRCGALSLLLRGAEHPHTALLSPARPSGLRGAEALLRDALDDPGEAPDDPRCACPRPPPRRVIAGRWHRALLGTGAEVIVEVVEGAGRVLRAPWDGPEVELSGDVDDPAVADALGRLPGLLPALRALCDEALATGASAYAPEPGQWLFAARPEALEGALTRLQRDASGADIAVVHLAPSTASAPPWSGLGASASGALAAGELRAGMLLDRARWMALTRLWLVRAGLALEEDADAGRLVARDGGLALPMAVGPVAASVLRLGLTLSEGAAVLAEAVVEQAAGAKRFLEAAAASRAGLRFVVEGTAAIPVLEGGRAGLPLDLLTLPARCPPGSERLARELRYACDELAPWADPTRVCRCGAAAHLSRRLVAWSAADAMYRAAPDDPPVVLQVLRAAEPVAALVGAVACDLHVSVLRRSEARALGLSDDELTRRAAAERWQERFRGRVGRLEGGRAGLALAAPWVASCLFDEALAYGVARDAGLGVAPLRVRAPSPNVLIVCDPACDGGEVARLDALGLALEGHAEGGRTDFLLERVLAPSSEGLGRFEVEGA